MVLFTSLHTQCDTVESVLSNHSKRMPQLVFNTDFHLMQVKSKKNNFKFCTFIWRPAILSHMHSKTCLKHHSKIDKTKVLMENGSLMKVESIAEC